MGDFDISIRSMTSEIMHKYDHNRNGVIDLSGSPEAAFGKDEMIFTQRQSQYVGKPIHAYTYRSLFEAADTDHDRHVTRGELERAIRRFDKDSDGKLSVSRVTEYGSFSNWWHNTPAKLSEYKVFHREFGEETLSTNWEDVEQNFQRPRPPEVDQRERYVSPPALANQNVIINVNPKTTIEQRRR